jgi:NAD(P)-dependent dehydrogenase (short-subunit alcohol dehydrogenase family)
MTERFTNKVVIITGGGAGIGRRYAHRFAAEGASVVIADVDVAAGNRVVDELKEKGASALSVEADVTSAAAAESTAASAVQSFGGIDFLINNAGVHLDHAQLPFTVEAAGDWRHVFDVNVIGPLMYSAACRPSMAARGGGVIINMSTMAAYGGGGAYSASKLALNSLTVSLGRAFGDDGIRVNGIAPGFVDSEAAIEWSKDPKRAGRTDIADMLIAGQMIKRQGLMEDLADMCLFLCSDQASFVTGQTILVDGGHTPKPF